MGRGIRRLYIYTVSIPIIIIIFCSVFALSYNLTKRVYSTSNAQTSSSFFPKPTISTQPTPSLKPQVSLKEESDFVINIYNGTKYSGLASGMGAILRSRGYKVGDISNAERRDYPNTLVKYQDSNGLESAKEIQNILEGEGYVVADPEEDGSIKSDIAIYLGKV